AASPARQPRQAPPCGCGPGGGDDRGNGRAGAEGHARGAISGDRMIPRFFIDRPIFANVIAIVTIIFGVVTLMRLPVEQYPPIVPPTVQVTTSYPGANAQVVADTVAAPIEQQVNGVEHMLYMSSVSASDGSYSLTVTFDVG